MIRQSGVNITIISRDFTHWYRLPPLWSDIFPRLSLTPDLHYLIINATAGIPLITPSPQSPVCYDWIWSLVSTNIKTIIMSSNLKASLGRMLCLNILLLKTN